MGVNLFQYLFKHFYKGFDEANWAIRRTQSDPTAPSGPTRKPVDNIKDYERGRYPSSIEAATRITSFHITEKKTCSQASPNSPNLPGKQRASKYGSESDRTLLVRYMTRPRHPAMEKMTYTDFGSKCRFEKYDPEKEMHPLQILED
jgi:hypothetical protein